MGLEHLWKEASGHGIRWLRQKR